MGAVAAWLLYFGAGIGAGGWVGWAASWLPKVGVGAGAGGCMAGAGALEVMERAAARACLRSATRPLAITVRCSGVEAPDGLGGTVARLGYRWEAPGTGVRATSRASMVSSSSNRLTTSLYHSTRFSASGT